MTFIRTEPNSTWNTHDTKRLELLTRLRLGKSHLVDHEFRHNFQDCVPPMCSRGQDIETRESISSFTAPSWLSKENPLSQDQSSNWKHLNTDRLYNYKDSAIRWQWPRFWNKQNFTGIYNWAHFINRKINLSLNRVNVNDSIVSLLFYS